MQTKKCSSYSTIPIPCIRRLGRGTWSLLSFCRCPTLGKNNNKKYPKQTNKQKNKTHHCHLTLTLQWQFYSQPLSVAFFRSGLKFGGPWATAGVARLVLPGWLRHTFGSHSPVGLPKDRCCCSAVWYLALWPLRSCAFRLLTNTHSTVHIWEVFVSPRPFGHY